MTTPTNPPPTAPASAEPTACIECGGPLQWRCPACRIAQSKDVAAPPQLAPASAEQFDESACRATCTICNDDPMNGGKWPCAKATARLRAAPPQLAEGERAELVKHLRDHHNWRVADAARYIPAAADLLDSQAAELAEAVEANNMKDIELARLRTENANLKTVMVAAAEEIAAHWNAHCDSEGYGPQNLMRRLEEGIPSEYGYTAGRFAELQAELAALRASAASVQADQRAELDRLRIRCAAYEEAYGIAYKATYQSHNGHWDSTMRGGAGCPECIRAREARENCDVALRNGLSALAALADKGEGAPPAPGGAA